MRCETQLKDEIESAKALGYSGKIAIHPSQVDLINELFSPSQEELDRAKAICSCLGSLELPTAIASNGGEMIGPPFAILARKLLATHQTVLDKNHKKGREMAITTFKALSKLVEVSLGAIGRSTA